MWFLFIVENSSEDHEERIRKLEGSADDNTLIIELQLEIKQLTVRIEQLQNDLSDLLDRKNKFDDENKDEESLSKESSKVEISNIEDNRKALEDQLRNLKNRVQTLEDKLRSLLAKQRASRSVTPSASKGDLKSQTPLKDTADKTDGGDYHEFLNVDNTDNENEGKAAHMEGDLTSLKERLKEVEEKLKLLRGG